MTTGMGKRLTVSDKLLLAARDLDVDGARTFTAEDLVVAAWRRFPRAFGLRGYNDEDGVPLYPDSNRVFAEIMGSKPVRKRGFLVKVGRKTYGLTASGREVTSELALGMGSDHDAISAQASGKDTLPREIVAKLQRLLKCRAVERTQQGELQRITFHDACVFWGITPGSTSIELEGALAEVKSIIEHTAAAVHSGASELHTGRGDLSQSTTDLLRAVHSHLQDRFSSELAVIRQRTDQRKA